MTIATFACRHHPTVTWRAPWRDLLGLVPHRQVALDVLAAAGVLRYGLNLQRAEARHQLARQGVFLSDGTISHLSDEFLVRFHHWLDTSRCRWAPRLRRGLVLLIDGTQDAGGPVTYRAVTHRQGVTVHAATLPSENEPDLVRFLEAVRNEVGTPRLIVRDGSTAARNACSSVFPSVPQGLCHWHWLRNAGEALLGDAYEALRRAVLGTRQLARLEDLRGAVILAGPGTGEPLRRALRVWTRLLLEDVLGARDATGGFPFRLAYRDVMVRVLDARRRVHEMVGSAVGWNVHEPLLVTAKERLDALAGDSRVSAALLVVDRRWSWFGRLRSWLRLEEARSGRPNEPAAAAGAGVDPDLVSGQVLELRAEARRAGPDEEEAWLRVVSRWLESRDELFPRVRLKDAPRTTAGIEVRHREDRRGCRRRTGTVSTRASMERVGEHLAVWSNVTNPWFVRYALEGADLVGSFARQDPVLVRAGVARLRAKRYRDRLPVAAEARGRLLDGFLTLVREGAPPEQLTAWADRVAGVA